jgi:hypothetical protein
MFQAVVGRSQIFGFDLKIFAFAPGHFLQNGLREYQHATLEGGRHQQLLLKIALDTHRGQGYRSGRQGQKCLAFLIAGDQVGEFGDESIPGTSGYRKLTLCFAHYHREKMRLDR